MHTLLAPPIPRTLTAAATGSELALKLLGPSTTMSHLWSQVRRLAPHVRTVLLTGQPDSGQDAVARLLLDLSLCPQRQLDVLGEPEAEHRLAHACQAHASPSGAFLFLPEVHRLSATGQQYLLRLLRTRRTRGLSVIAASAEDLRSLSSMGRFLPDLAEILGAVRIAVPPLKDRVEDIPMLLGQTLSLHWTGAHGEIPQLSEEFLRAAMQHSWPGNLRELSEVAEALLADSTAGEEFRTADLLRALRAVGTPRPGGPAPLRMVKLDTVVQEHIYAVLRGCRGNKLKAAEVLGISRSTLYRMLDAAAQNISLPIAS